jgi:hypothetical protein
MAVISTATHPKALWPGVKAFFGKEYAKHGEEHKDLFDIDDSDKAYEEDVQTSGFGLAPVKSEGSSVSYDSETQGYTKRYTHVAYGLGYIVTYEELRDNLYKDKAFKRAAQLAFSMYTTKQIVGANVYNRAFDSNYTGGDGVCLLSAAHPTRAGNQSNVMSTSSDLSEAAIEEMVIDIMEAKNDRGLQINLMPKSLIVAPANYFEAQRILKSVQQSGTANNDANILKLNGVIPEGAKVNHFLTDADAWFIRTNCPDGMKHYVREAMSFDQDNDFDTKNAKAAAYERFSFGWSDWRGLFGSAGA